MLVIILSILATLLIGIVGLSLSLGIGCFVYSMEVYNDYTGVL